MRHAFAYGSGVFNQPVLYESDGKKAMIDFIIVERHGITRLSKMSTFPYVRVIFAECS